MDMLQKNWFKAGFAILTAAGLASAHLIADGMKPAVGESLTPGATYAITWKVQFAHSKGTNIDLSVDGGSTWTTVRENFKEASGTNTFNWTVAGAATQTAKIRICQHDDATTAGCKDSETTNSLTTTVNGNYILVGPAFTIASGSGLRQAAGPQGSFALDFNPATRNVNVSFALAESGPVLLQAFDTRGRLMATLVEGDFAPGSHKLSLFSNRLETSGALLFKLKAGAQVQSHHWTPAR
jgi:hypothetical protein